MKITELDEFEQSPSPIIYGVEIDGECFTPPPGLEQVGLLWKGDGPDQIDDDLVDTIIAFGLSGVDVVLEVRPGDEVDHAYLLTLAGNAGFSIAAIPPSSEDDVEGWQAHCCAFARAFLTTPNFAKSLYPVSGYLSYLIAEFFAGADALAPNDPYTIQRFVEAAPVEWSDQCKAQMRAAMSDTLGGGDQLEKYLGALITSLFEEAEKFVLEAAGTPEA